MKAYGGSIPIFVGGELVATVTTSGEPDVVDHETAVAGVAIKMSETPGRVRHRAPLLGEHTDEYLKSIGCSAADIARLRAGKIVA